MKGDPKIIDILNDVLTAELTAINQYFIHARMQKHWGFPRIAERVRKESIDEMNHAQQIMDRILFLEGLPNMQRLNKVNIGETVPEQFRLDLAEEYKAVTRLRDGVRVCRDAGDKATEEFLTRILESEEEHIDWLETQIELIQKLGEQNYLAEQLYES